MLLSHQRQAIDFVEAAACTTAQDQALTHVEPAGQDAGFDRHVYERLAHRIAGGYPIDVHFHPDRLTRDGLTVVESLAKSLVYENQFVTGVSNGALDTTTSGKRRRWESRMFGAAYDSHPDVDRPKYGALNLFDTQDGACPRFGSCYLRLRPESSHRCSLSYGDSHTEPAARGTVKAPWPILNALALDVFGNRNTSLAQHALRLRRMADTNQPLAISQGRILDDIIEVQLHGVLSLSSDVSQLSADSAFQGTPTGMELVRLSTACGIELVWRPALVLSFGPIPIGFRGKALTCFVESIRKDGCINVAELGEVARSVVSEPASWSAWGAPPQVMQLVKQTWHAMVAFGDIDVDDNDDGKRRQ